MFLRIQGATFHKAAPPSESAVGVIHRKFLQPMFFTVNLVVTCLHDTPQVQKTISFCTRQHFYLLLS